jgi:hypothetical protein
MNNRILNLLLALTLLTGLRQAAAQGTAFTYQGQLSANGAPADGSYDLTFTLYTNSSGAAATAGPITNLAIGVSNGLFTATINFEADVFTGASNWLQIAARTNGNGAFTTLTPRQEITATPYALFAPNAGLATAAGSADSVAAANISGTLVLHQLPAAVLTNGQTDATLGGAFSGNGVGLTNLEAGNLTGALPAISGASLTSLDASQLTSRGNTLGENNFFVGNAGNASVSGYFNTVMGFYAFINDSTGAQDTAIGNQALYANSSGAQNTAIGSGTLSANSTGNGNTALGFQALLNNWTGNGNTAAGVLALGGLGINSGVGGSNNIALGYQAGCNFLHNESSNIDIGHPGVAGENNIIRIGSNQTAAYFAGVINGNGGGLTNLNASQLSGGTIPLAQLPSAVLTNDETGAVTLGGTLNLPSSVTINSGASLFLYADGDANFFAGPNAGNSSLTGDQNTGSGVGALFSDTSGRYNTAIGYQALNFNTSGYYNTACGNEALFDNRTGWYNTAIGYGALGNYNGGSNNTATGYSALGLFFNHSGNNNTANGFQALAASGGTNNIALGYQSGFGLGANESSNIDIGNAGFAGDNDTIRIGDPAVHTNAVIAGFINGNGGGLTNLTAANLTGALPALDGANLTGLSAGNITGTLPAISGANLTSLNASRLTSLGNADSELGGNFFVGNAGNAANTGSNNTALGNSALFLNTSGSENTAMGADAMVLNKSGSNNTGSGFEALLYNESGVNNTAFGSSALSGLGFQNVGGSNNIALGYQAGYHYLANESGNIDIGNVGTLGENNNIHIGTQGVQTNTTIAGNVGLGTSSPGEILEVSGPNAAMRVRNQNDPVGGFIGDSYYAVQLGMYNPTNIMEGLLDAGQKRSFFGFDYQTGQVGSLINNYGATIFRNVLDDGNGNLTTTGTINGSSDRNLKENFQTVAPAEVLDKVAALPITRWNFKNDKGIEHIGPMAQDFHAAFGVGMDERHIATVDEGGIALAAIQGLNQKLNEKEAEIQILKEKADKVDALEKQLNELKQMVQALANK